MSSMGGQWRIIRHYLSLTNLNAEVEKLVAKLKPATPEQWDDLVKRFEKVIASKLKGSQTSEERNIISKDEKLDDSFANSITAASAKDNDLDKEKSASTEIQPVNKIELKVEAPLEQMTTNKEVGLSMGSDAKEITIRSLLRGLKLKKDLHFGKISDESWKENKPTVTKTSIHSRTAYVISAIVTAETTESLLRRTEHFIDHLKQYPEARDYAIKQGGVRALLRVQRQMVENSVLVKEVKGMVNEALALLGYMAPVRGPGPNILSIDGGGIRGLIAIEVLRHLERLTGRKVNEIFDYIVGVSTGAIIAAVIGSGVGTLDTASDMYYNLSKKMFGSTSLIGGTSRLVWTHSYYDTEAWEKLLQENLQQMTLTQCNRRNTDPKLSLVSCVVNSGSRLSPFLFRSYEMPFRVRSVFPGTSSAKVWQAVRASAAAPTYFEEFKLDGLVHQDGGIMVNNPSGVGLHEARLLYGAKDVLDGCLVSLGTGRALTKQASYEQLKNKETLGTSWKDKFNKILDSATDTEGVHLVLNDLLPVGGYYRFNPPLLQEVAMDEIDHEKLNGLVQDTQAYIRRNQEKFNQAATMLTRKRPLNKKIADYVEYQSEIMGIKST